MYYYNCFGGPIPAILACIQVDNPQLTPVPTLWCASPIIIDIDGGGIQLTSWQNGVSFDVGADGITEQTGWTAQFSTNCFLALDRNGNGKIDNGAELFGNGTPQPASDAPNGYEALAVFDDLVNGGNGDYAITNSDSVFANLRLWCDTNHDGASSANELFTLSQKGVQVISLDYRALTFVDSFENAYHYKSWALVNAVKRNTYDIFFKSAQWQSQQTEADPRRERVPREEIVSSQRGTLPRVRNSGFARRSR
jgi:hypothetical protein